MPKYRVFRTFKFWWDVDADGPNEAIEATEDAECNWSDSEPVDPTLVEDLETGKIFD